MRPVSESRLANDRHIDLVIAEKLAKQPRAFRTDAWAFANLG